MALNSFADIDPKLVDIILPPSGYPDELAAEDTPDALRECCGAATREFPNALWIEPGPGMKHWAEIARENDKNHTWGMNYVAHYTNQDPTDECTTHSEITQAMACRNRQLGIKFPDGPKKGFIYPETKTSGHVNLSCLSIYAEANPRHRGGANVRQVLEIACRRGILPDRIQPREYNFKHTLTGTCGGGNESQSRGPWIPLSRFPDGWEETAKHFKPLEVIFVSSWEQAVCLILHGLLNSVGRNGHAIPWAQAIFKGDTLTHLAYPDSYNITRYDSLSLVKQAWQGSFCIATMTTPDSWDKPAG